MLIDGIKNSDSKPFGWKHSTHRLFVARAIEKANFSMPSHAQFNDGILNYSCVEPDLSRKYVTKFIHGHFADIDNLSSDPPDAYALVQKYTDKALEAHKVQQYNKRDNYLGYALHFLQDMLNPMHVVFNLVPKEHPERIAHKHFEQIATTIENEVVENTELQQIPEFLSFFDEVLPVAMRDTKYLHNKINVNNHKNFLKIARQSLETTYQMTEAYLQRFVSELSYGNSKWNRNSIADYV